MPGLFGGGETRTVVEGRDLTPQELELIGIQTQLAREQLSQIRHISVIAGTSPGDISVGAVEVAPVQATISQADQDRIEDLQGQIPRRGMRFWDQSPNARLRHDMQQEAARRRVETFRAEAQQRAETRAQQQTQARQRRARQAVEGVAERSRESILGAAPPAELVGEQVEATREEQAFEQQLREILDPAATAAAEAARTQAEDLSAQIGRITQAQEKIQEDILRGQTASPEDLAAIQEAADRAIEAGLVDIGRFQTEGLEQLRNVMAPARGLRPSDSPIFERGGDVVAEATRQAGQLFQNVRGQQAQQELAFPLARRAADLSATGLQAQMGQATQQFQRDLRQRSFMNRLTLGSALGDIGMSGAQFAAGLALGIPADVRGSLAAIAGAQGSTQRTREPVNIGAGLANLGTAAAGAGGLLKGLAGVGLISSREAKDRIGSADVDALLAGVKLLPLDWWRYRGESGQSRHIGPYAEDVLEKFGIGDGKVIPVTDALGVLFALVKALSLKVA